MRRIFAALTVPLLVGLALAGCGSSSKSASSSSSANPNTSVSVTGAFGKTPDVTIPKVQASTKLAISTPIKGTGAVVPTGDDVLANLAIYTWDGKTNKLLDSTFTSIPQILPANVGLKGLATAVKGQKVGSRILAVLPPAYGYGTSGNSQLGVTGKDTTIWVIDLIKAISPTAAASGQHVSNGGGNLPTVKAGATGTAPTVTIPKNAPPSKLTVKTLIKGTGPKLTTGETVIAQYTALIYRTKKVFNETWPSSTSAGTPFSFTLGGSDVIPGFIKGLTGVPVGSRVMLVIPPSEGYGKTGQSSVGIKGTDTLVFVVDVLAALPAASS
jgi:FKBP-type peptidyl-prolyl cis-trans isomerase